MQITNFHATYYSHILTQKNAENMLIATLQDSKLDLNPHQIEAALFALRSPFSRGIIEADEVGLGKTIVAGLIIAQKWAEMKQKILIIVPANLRRQWQVELEEKFYLESVIIDGETFAETAKIQENPFLQNCIVITSYNFAYSKADYIKEIDWDIAILDEAHKMRNVYKKDNVIARSIRTSLRDCFKLLLTATPLQNSLLELFGLTSFIDDYIFGSIESFKVQFSFLRDEKQKEFSDLVERIRPICIRTLRSQVLEYIKYTERLPITQEFVPTKNEQILYDKFSSYLQRDDLWAIPAGGKSLIVMVLWKLLASSTFAIAGTLEKIILRLEYMYEHKETVRNVKVKNLDDGLVNDSEEEIIIEKRRKLTEKELLSLKAEIDELKEYHSLAVSIKENAKGNALFTALEKGFKKLKELKAPQKAVIFTESRRTQEYIYKILENSKYKGKSILYFGGMVQKKQEEIKEKFKNEIQIMVATESAAEGLNLQFCPMCINYDLPYNPQRIEQRIGRCHRYGQQNDVVVINFLNKNNVADQRVYELLCDKFQLFEGVFGASDGILGSIDSLNFEKRIIEIYQKCRTTEEIEREFAELREYLLPQIDEKVNNIRQKLLENFDDDVAKRLKENKNNSENNLTKFESLLWEVTKFKLEERYADFDDSNKSFYVYKNPYYNKRHNFKRHQGEYYLDKKADLSERYRFKCSLAQTILFEFKHEFIWHYGSVTFDLSGYKGRFSNLEHLKNKSGYMALYNMEIIYNQRREEQLVFAGYCIDGEILSQKQMSRMFELSGNENDIDGNIFYSNNQLSEKIADLFELEKEHILEKISIQDSNYYEEETNKIVKWARDIKISLELDLRSIDKSIDEIYVKLKAKNLTLKQRLDLQERLSELEPKRKELRMKIYDEQDKIDDERKKLIEEIKKKLILKTESKKLFTIEWKII